MNKKSIIATVVSAILLLAGTASACTNSPLQAIQDRPITGSAVKGMESYDSIIPDVLQRYRIPGASVAVARNGVILYSRGFGWADVENRKPVAPDALFRIASVSKPITSAAIMKLVEAQRLKLDDKVWPYLDDLPAAPNAAIDPRWQQITIRMLLNHSAGFDRDKSFDPMFRPAAAAAAVGANAPASAETIIRYMKAFPLDFDPGTRNSYSNFGYAILGHVIERVSGSPYESFVKANVLKPAGITRMQLGHTRHRDAAAGEVRYYMPGYGINAPLVPSVFPGEGSVAVTYGGFYLEAMAAHGAWIASAPDLLRFINAVDGRAAQPDILTPSSIQQLIAHDTRAYPASDVWYGAGWQVRPTGGDANWWHNGSLPGTTSLIVRAYNGYSWAILLNARDDAGAVNLAVDRAMWDALRLAKL